MTEKHAKSKADMDLEFIRLKLKWDKEIQELNQLCMAKKQKKESTEVEAMITKNRNKQRQEREETEMKMLKHKNTIMHGKKNKKRKVLK